MMPPSARFGSAPRRALGGRAVLGLIALAGAVAYLAALRLASTAFALDVTAALTGAATTAAVTVPVALRTWLVLALLLLAVGGWLRRRAPELDGAEAAVGAIVLLWAAADVALLTLGPLGWCRPLVLRAGLLLVVAALLRPARRRRAPITPGAWIAIAAFALSLAPLLILQIGSPVSPFMDVLALVAGVQKIVVFRHYDPFGNDASGLVALGRGSVGYDAPLSLLALVAGASGPLTITSLIVPVAAFQILALYLLGRAAHGPLAGGMASLFLLETFTWRRTPDVRGTALAFALVAAGLALLVARRRTSARTALGGLALGVAVTVNPLIGALGMLVASVQTVVAWLDVGAPLVAPVAALAAGSLFALPQVAIGLGWTAPTWALPLVMAAGVLATLGVARAASAGRPTRRPARALLRPAVLVALPAAVLLTHARRRFEFVDDQWFTYAGLALLASGGLVVATVETWRRPGRRPGAAVVALALALGMALYVLTSPHRFQGVLEVRSLASEITTKMIYYWWPYWLALATGVWFAMVARRWSLAGALALALVLVIYPLRQSPELLDYDTAQLSLAESWGFQLGNAARGYHAGRPDRRWVIDARWRTLTDLLRDEIAAGRIRYDTHVVHVTAHDSSVEVPLWTGISMDLYTPRYSPESIWHVGTRIRGLDKLPAALAARPPYVLVQEIHPPPIELGADYTEILTGPGWRLYRRTDGS